jgi:hypothetical protein
MKHASVRMQAMKLFLYLGVPPLEETVHFYSVLGRR